MKRLLTGLAGEDAGALGAAYVQAARAHGLAPDAQCTNLATAVSAAYPALRAHVLSRPEDIVAIARGRIRIARDLATYRRLAAPFLGDKSPEAVRRGLRLFAQRERLRVAARELVVHEGADLDVTARELSDLAQVCIEIALAEALAWAEQRFGTPVTASGERCPITVLGMGKLGGRELNCGSDVDLIPFYETDEGEVQKDGRAVDQTLHEHFTRVTQRLTSTLEDVTEDGLCWRVDLRLRPEGSRGPLVNALAAAERYYETWGRTWERAALLRSRPVAGDPEFGARVMTALVPFVWRKVVDPRLASEMAEMLLRSRAESTADPARDLKVGRGGIREAEFFVQSLQLIWGGREPSVRPPNTLEALRRLRARGLVTDRESREVETAYLFLRKLEHRVQFATGIQTHELPEGELLERIARSVGCAAADELQRSLEKTRGRVAALFGSIQTGPSVGAPLAVLPIYLAIDAGDEAALLAALAEPVAGRDFSTSASPDLARHLLALARRPDFPLGASSRDRYPELAPTLLEALADAADPEQAARLLAAFVARLATPSVYAKAMAEDRKMVRKLASLFGASAFLGQALAFHPELVDRVLFAKDPPTPESAARDVEDEVAQADIESTAGGERIDPEDAFVGALRRAKARVTMEVGVAELAGELRTREAMLVQSSLADATLALATQRALREKGLSGGLAVVAMGKLGGREIGYGSDLDIIFVYDGADGDDSRAEKYVRAAQRVLRLVSTPHGDGPGYELDTRLRPSGTQGLLVVSIDAFARYHGVVEGGGGLEGLRGLGIETPASHAHAEAQDWERQSLIKARPCAGDAALGARVLAMASKVAYERGAPDPARVHHLRMRMQYELAREGPSRYDVKVGRGGIVDVEFAVQWLQMKHGLDPRVRTPDTELAITALESCGHLEAHTAAILREGYAMLRRLEQSLRVVHGTSARLIEEGAPGLGALARRLGYRDGPLGTAESALLRRYRAVTGDVRAAYLAVLGLPPEPGAAE